LFRNPVIMFGLGPILSFAVLPRLVRRGMRPRLQRAVIRTNVILLLLVGAVCVWIGPLDYLLIQWPAAWGNIGYHHVHHLSARVPNYNLPAAHDAIELFRDAPVLDLRSALRSTRLKVWDERRRRLVTFADAADAA
jgi:omega-6 fatty acid desaturase (delta-12 desaturase)